ncbi:MAG: VOC family protein [Chloroflexi bacterium]|nr:VOC family protein [Chloroflexota bacterium]MBV9133259.1 VOC family protein [Chloroflexota bacterium]MBV9893782.1 VOC family protein [Chloroflexota bacterium]
MQTSQASQIVGIHTVGIRVTDQERALRFYADVLGLQTRVDRALGNGARWIELAPAEAGVTLALEPATNDAPAGTETGIRLITLDADAENARLKSQGVEVGEVLRWPGVPPMFMFHDPDGNRMEIIQQA